MNRQLVIAIVAAVALVAIISLAVHFQRVLVGGLPPRDEFETVAQAREGALAWQAAHGGNIISIAGTGSEAPFIPAARPSEDPMTVVAYVVTEPGKKFADITPGRLLVYRPDWRKGGSVMHQAAQLSGDGWIMSGLHNKNSEPFERMTPDKFDGLVAYAAVRRP